MTEKDRSKLPPAPLSGGPVLCMYIDGTSAPTDQYLQADMFNKIHHSGRLIISALKLAVDCIFYRRFCIPTSYHYIDKA